MKVGELKRKLNAACSAMQLDTKTSGLRVLWGDLGELGRRRLDSIHRPVIDHVTFVYSDESSLLLVMSVYGNEAIVSMRTILEKASKLDDSMDVLVEYESESAGTCHSKVDGLLVDDEAGEVFLHPRDSYENSNTCDQDASTWRYGPIRIFDVA